MNLQKQTITYQSDLANYCRTGKLNPIPLTNTSNVEQYRRLIYNIVDDMLQTAYPLTYDLLSVKEWKKAVNDFFSNHPCLSPQVWYMPKEFYEYISSTKYYLLDKYPYLEDLLRFEWVEVELFMMEDITINYISEGSLTMDKLVLNPEHQLLSFYYPVHSKNSKYITNSDLGTYFVIAHRQKCGEILFTEIRPALLRMVEYLTRQPLTITQLKERLEKEYSLEIPSNVQSSIIQFFEHALKQELIIGFDKN